MGEKKRIVSKTDPTRVLEVERVGPGAPWKIVQALPVEGLGVTDGPGPKVPQQPGAGTPPKRVDLSQPLPSSAPQPKVDPANAGDGKGAIAAIGTAQEQEDAATDAAIKQRGVALKADDPGVGGTIGRSAGRGLTGNFGDELFSQLGSLGVMKSMAAKMPSGAGQGAVSLPADPAQRAAVQQQRRQPMQRPNPEAEAIPKTFAAGSEQEDMRQNLEQEFNRGKMSRPGLSRMGELGGGALQGAMAGPLMRGMGAVGGIAPRLAGTAAQGGIPSAMARMAVTGAGAGAGGAALSAAGEAQPGQRMAAARDAAPGGALVGGVAGPVLGGLFGLAARIPRGLRGRQDMAALPIAEQLDPAIQTRTGVVPRAMGGSGVGLDPITSSPKIARAQTAQATGEGINATGRGAAGDIAREESAKTVLGGLNKLRGANRARISTFMDEYGAGPHGQTKRPMDNAFSAIEEMIDRGTDSTGRPIPDEDLSELRGWLAQYSDGTPLPRGANTTGLSVMTRQEAQKHGVPISETTAPRTQLDPPEPPRSAPTVPPPSASMTRQAKLAEKAAAKDRGQEQIMLSPRKMSALEMEQALSNTYDKARPGDKIQRSALKSEKLGSRLRAERDNFPGGYGQARQQHAKDTADIDNIFDAAGLDMKLRSVDAGMNDQVEAVKRALVARQLKPDELAMLEKEAPEAIQAIRDAYAQGAYDEVLSMADPVNTIAKGFRHNAMLRVDAVARSLSGTGRSTVKGVERSPAQRTATMGKRVGFANNLARLLGAEQQEQQQ